MINGPGRHRHVRVLISVAAVVLALDVISKLLVVAKLSDRDPVRLLGGFLKLEETRNAGAAFSIGTGATFLFAFVAIGVIVVIVRSARRLYSRPWAVVLGLLLGGATGNLIDRLVRAPGVFRGEVVDWIRLPHFAVFNLADSAITIGGVLAVWLALRGHQMDGSTVAVGKSRSSGHQAAVSDEARGAGAGSADPASPTRESVDDRVDDPLDEPLR
jgi:signal peptidase II